MRTRDSLSKPAADPKLWLLDRQIVFLNHGSFGACPKAVLKHQQELRERVEREPVDFLVRELEGALDNSRTALARFVGARAGNLVFVPNATAGVNTVLRSLDFRRGDELLVTNQEYNASRNALAFAAGRSGAKIAVARIPFPLRSEDDVVEAVLSSVTSRTRLALLDHVTSQTGMILPLAKIIAALAGRGVETLVDGAHAPGMIPLNLEKLGAAYYTGNCHKWVCAPKSAGFLYVRPDLQQRIHPLSISHGANSTRKDRSRFLIEFGWTGTWDPTAMLSVPKAIEYMGTLASGGWAAIMRRNRTLALAGREELCKALEIEKPCPDDMIGSLAAVPIWDAESNQAPKSPLYLDSLQEKLRKEAKIEVPVIPWPLPGKRLIRISAQLYNSLGQYELLAGQLAGFKRKSARRTGRTTAN